uniref:Protein translocase subunit SecD n=1 Tax=candidate division WOR-3 bacterium TaxID=2052148 RepID=A0A7V3PUX8_UNCW3
MKGARIKLAIWLVVVLVAGFLLWPSFQLYIIIPRQERLLKERLAAAATVADSQTVINEINEFNRHKASLYEKRIIHLGLDLVGGMHVVLDIDRSQLTEEEARRAPDLALEVIRNRIDQFGVFEPTIQKTDKGRILVQLPGVDRERALNIIKQPAHLTFQLVEEKAKAYDALKTIDEKLQALGLIGPVTDTTSLSPPVDSSKQVAPGSLLSYLRSETDELDLMIAAEDTAQFSNLLNKGRDYWPQGYEFRFGPVETEQYGKVVRIYLLKSEPELMGTRLRRAEPSIYQGTDLERANTWVVNFELDREGAAKFAQITGRNVGRRLAIVLDGVVRSAPRIQERIPNGRGQITLNDRRGDKAKDLAIVLNSGALPAPVIVVEERSIGASLGADAIRRGIIASVVGAVIVVIFMLVYYGIGGVLADLALFLNVFILLAALAALRATLTLPGLAGIALTIGMAVDANVLVFERIREELQFGKTPMAAVDSGYQRALVTIIDANATTIITAIALYFIGSGPVRGFAITLAVGLIINVFTAVFLTRFIFDWFLARFEVKNLRI